MCLAVVALDTHPAYLAVVIANRDEFHAREALPAHWWREGFLAGRDLAGGGTWLGVTRRGRWAFLTNVREPERRDPAAPTRGALVTQVLASAQSIPAALDAIVRQSASYNGFNLLAGDRARAAWCSNRARKPQPLAEGVHGISNAALDTPWPKVVGTKAAVTDWCAAGERDPAALFAALARREVASDDALPSTGVGLAWERRLSAPFIVGPEYGTRCSTVILLGRDGKASFEERAFDPAGALVDVARHLFGIES